MKTNSNNNRENMNAAAPAASYNKINDFGAKIGGARKDQYQAAREWADKLADITADKLAAAGLSKLVRLPNLESMTAAGAISAEQARAALALWRTIDKKPAGTYKADRWADRTRETLAAIAAILTAEDLAAVLSDDLAALPDFQVLTAANWPAEAFNFGRYQVRRRPAYYSNAGKLGIIGGRYYVGTSSDDPADIVRQLREMTAADAEKAAESRARGPRLGVYHTNDYTRYFIAVENKCEIVLKVCNTYQEATEAARNERAELLKRYESLKNFPALRRSWNRPRVGKEWHAEDVTPEQFAAVIPFKGVEFGNWLNQDERAALLNSAFDGFHDLADLLGIAPAAVSLGGRLNFSFATRGHAGSAAHFDSCYNTINLNKRNGAGCMAHEWLHACDHFAAVLAGRGSCTSWGEAFATECNKESNHPADIAARELVAAIRKMDYYTRSKNYQAISGKSQGGADYYTQPCELAARGFEGVVLYLLNCAGGCSDFLVNLQSWRDFERDDAGHRRDCYPYPSDAEAAALVPYYVAFFRALFGSCQVSEKAAEGVAAATLQAQQEKAEADRRAAEKAEQERKESEERRAARRAELDRKAEEQRKENERKAAEVKAKAEATRAAIVERLTAAHFDTIATDCDAAAVYFAAHLEGEIYTGKADIKSDPAEIAATVQAAPVACLQYKYIHNAKRVICHRWQVASVRSNKRTARELLESLQPSEVRDIVRTFADNERADNWQKAARIWSDTQRTNEAQKPANEPANGNQETGAPAEGLQLINTADGVAVIGNSWKNTYFNKKQIKAHGATWNKEAKQWEATDPADVARLRAWFALREVHTESTESTESTPAATLEEAGEIIVKLCERIYNDTAAPVAIGNTVIYNKFKGETPRRAVVTGYDDTIKMYFLETEDGQNIATGRDGFAVCGPESSEEEPAAVALPDWLRVGARVRTRGRYMMSTRSTRPQWVKGEEMEITAISADFVNLKSDTARESVSTANAAAELTPIYSASEISQPAESEPAAIAASEEEGAPLTEPNRDGLPDWLHVGTRFCLLDFVTGKPTAARYTCAAIDYENKTVTIPEAADTFRGGSHVYRWDAFHWATFAPVTDDTDPTPDPSGEGVGVCHSHETGAPCYSTSEKSEPTAQQCETGTAGRVKWARNAEVITTEEMGRVDVFEIVDEWPAGYYVWLIGREHFPLAGWLPLAQDGHNAESFQRNIDRDHLKAIKVQSEAAALACMDYAYHHDRPTRSDFLRVLAQYPTDPTPDPSGEGVGVCHSYETGAPCYSTSEKSEPTRNQEIAKNILQQLGGRQFAMMTGAKQFVAIDNGVRFRIGRNATRANLVKIVLRGDDTYNMEFWHIGQEVNPYTILMRYANKGLSEEEFNKQVKAATERAEKAAEPVKLKAYEGIYCDQLQELFAQYTELYTRLF